MGKIMQSRPVEMGEVVEYHANPRRGDVGVIKESLEAHGQYRPIVVNVGTHAEHQMEILAGNHTFRAAKELGWEQIDAVLVDVDDEEAARIVLVDNRSSDLAENDGQTLADLLRSLPTLDGAATWPLSGCVSSWTRYSRRRPVRSRRSRRTTGWLPGSHLSTRSPCTGRNFWSYRRECRLCIAGGWSRCTAWVLGGGSSPPGAHLYVD